MKATTALLLGLAASSPLTSQSAIISGYGAYASTSTASNCSSGCSTANGGDFQYNRAGVEFGTIASSTETSYATANAYSSLTGSTYLPELRVETIADAGRGGVATAFGVQGYTYTGSDPFMFTLDYNLHGSVGANPTGSINNNGLRADVAILIGNNLEWYPSFATLVYEVAYNLDAVAVDSVFLSDGIDANTGGSISFQLNSGDEFYVVGSVGARSVDGFADGWNTLSLNFQDDTGLAAVSAVPVSAVPVPAAVWLLASGMIGLTAVARRKTKV